MCMLPAFFRVCFHVFLPIFGSVLYAGASCCYIRFPPVSLAFVVARWGDIVTVGGKVVGSNFRVNTRGAVAF